MLIEEAPYLVDDKALEKCQGKSLKDQFHIKIDSIRKSLGIEALSYVKLLVDVFYNYQKEHEAEIARRIAEEEAEYNNTENENLDRPHQVADDSKKAADAAAANNASHIPQQDQDPNRLHLDPDLITAAL